MNRTTRTSESSSIDCPLFTWCCTCQRLELGRIALFPALPKLRDGFVEGLVSENPTFLSEDAQLLVAPFFRRNCLRRHQPWGKITKAMSLSGGSHFGPYEILDFIGAGGMGEVYRARDTRLDRIVAVKVLPGHRPQTPEVRQRFEREARAISALNHPHICTLHDIGSEDGTDFLVMEYLEGETLADRLKRGVLPLAEQLKVASEIADALEKAHRLGIVHRDLKPGNVMLTKSGAKLLDFGLAKPAGGATAAGNATAPLLSAAMTVNSPSPQQSPLTQQGTLIGTVQYMSPEQIQGLEADTRSDIFAFGA